MHDSAAANADRHVVYTTIFRIKDKISRSCTGYADLLSYTGLGTRCSRQTNSKFTEYCLGETRTVCTMGQAGTAIYIRISYKLQGIGSDGRTVAASDGTAGIVTAATVPSRRFFRRIGMIGLSSRSLER